MKPQTFDITTARDLIAKLERELKRMDEGSREDRADAAFNFAVTAWATVEWLHRDIQKLAAAGAPLSAEIAPFVGVPNSNLLKHHLAGPMDAIGDLIPELKTCQVVANASKHATEQRSIPPVDATVSASTALTIAEWDRIADVISIGTGEMVSLKLVIGGSSHRAVPLFERIERKLR
ncbi:MAG TPA: hypothetical protein VLE26_03270, partial [Alphaproteobacteria bacterium]|nr:hypothetical protein [Alphaproteobacteria bacterium]